MNIKLNDKYIKNFVTEKEIASYGEKVKEVDNLIKTKTGKGSDFLGWMTASCAYDKDEYARLSAAAERIKKSCDIFIVIGIGGSYLGSRAVI